MSKLLDVTTEMAAKIRRAVESHNFSTPRIVDFEDPDYDVTLLVSPAGSPTMLDVAGLMNELEESLGLRAFVLTDDEFETTALRTGTRPEVVAV